MNNGTIKTGDGSRRLAKIIGTALLYGSIQSSLGSVEMSSKFSVLSFSKDQDTLQRASDALQSYVIIATIWTLGSALVLYAQYGNLGAVVGVIANIALMAWMIISYWDAFGKAAKKYNLKMPSFFWINNENFVAYDPKNP